MWELGGGCQHPPNPLPTPPGKTVDHLTALPPLQGSVAKDPYLLEKI